MTDQMMTLREAAERYGYAAATLRQAVRDRGLAATKYGNTWVVTQAAIEAYLQEGRGVVGRPRGPRRRPEQPEQGGGRT